MGQSLLTALVIVVLCGTASSVAASRMLRQTGNQAESVASGTGPAGGAYYSGAFDPARAASYYYCRVYGPDGYGIVLPSGTTCYFGPDPAASYGPVGAAGYGGATLYGRAFLPASAAPDVRASDPTGAASRDSGPGGVAASNYEPAGFPRSQSASGSGTASGLAAAAAAILRAQLGDPQNY